MKKEQVKSANWIPWLMVALFLVVLSVDVFFIYIANKSWTGIAVEDSYKKGLKYNNTIEAVNKQKLLGWNSTINYNSDSSLLRVKLFDKKNEFLQGAKILAKFRRPIGEGFDFEIPLQFNGKNAYQSLVTFPLKGQWDVELQVVKENDIYQNVDRIIVN